MELQLHVFILSKVNIKPFIKLMLTVQTAIVNMSNKTTGIAHDVERIVLTTWSIAVILTSLMGDSVIRVVATTPEKTHNQKFLTFETKKKKKKKLPPLYIDQLKCGIRPPPYPPPPRRFLGDHFVRERKEIET